jgi:hypothetical protein
MYDVASGRGRLTNAVARSTLFLFTIGKILTLAEVDEVGVIAIEYVRVRVRSGGLLECELT